MCIVLSETLALESTLRFLTGLLPTVDGPKFGESEGQIPVRALLRGVNFHVMRAIHWFEHVTVNIASFHQVRQLATGAALIGQFFHQFPFDKRRVLRILVVREMPRCPVQIQLANMRREHL